MTKPILTVVVPGLLGPFPGMDQPGFPQPAAPALTRLLNAARATKNPARSLEEYLFPFFGINRPAQADWPTAPVMASYELDEAGKGYWLRADPVHLRPDQSRLILFGADGLAIQQQEADALAQAFNELYREDGWQLFTPAPDRWYLRLPAAPAITTTALQQVLGRDVDPRLPKGEDAAHWHRTLNEIQMLFHSHAINQSRDQQGRPTINSVWFWGGGLLPEIVKAEFGRCRSNALLPAALASAAGIVLAPLPDSSRDIVGAQTEEQQELLVLDDCLKPQSYDDVEDWMQAVVGLESRWFAELESRIAAGQISGVRLAPLHGKEYQLAKPGWLKRLRRQRPLLQFI